MIVVPQKWSHQHLTEVGSTNDTALALIDQAGDDKTDPGGTVVTASVQTKGRGRFGRSWESPLGNLHASIILMTHEQHDFGQMSYLMACAVGDALAVLVGDDGLVEHKWPNDILLNGKKIAGILIEARRMSDELTGLVFGVGVNLVAHPSAPDIEYNATNLEAETSLLMAPEELMRLIQARLLGLLEVWNIEG